ncbi:uncharacterized protein LOC113202309 isoform X1 [Frankliniella occidentalis]|uniref:Uncharacterized protein LOC113202309 isoform X1 n=1 Tax=Frankliniella occidentalis TaxID=133901 RepID=A0A6J1S0B8_FRAOC|nr:uncharacterized protein LOC113202309 isoform X1 [Frankliniella occidentalis]
MLLGQTRQSSPRHNMMKLSAVVLVLLGLACYGRAAAAAAPSAAQAVSTVADVRAALEKYDTCADDCEPTHSRCHDACAGGHTQCAAGCLVGMFNCAYKCGRLLPPYPEVAVWESQLAAEKKTNETKELLEAQTQFISVKQALQLDGYKNVPKISELVGCFDTEGTRLMTRFNTCAESVACKLETVQTTIDAFCKCGAAWVQRTSATPNPELIQCYTATKPKA